MVVMDDFGVYLPFTLHMPFLPSKVSLPPHHEALAGGCGNLSPQSASARVTSLPRSNTSYTSSLPPLQPLLALTTPTPSTIATGKINHDLNRFAQHQALDAIHAALTITQADHGDCGLATSIDCWPNIRLWSASCWRTLNSEFSFPWTHSAKPAANDIKLKQLIRSRPL